MNRTRAGLILSAALIIAFAACDGLPSDADLSSESATPGSTARLASQGVDPGALKAGPSDDVYEFSAPVFDIAAAPNGNIIVAETQPIGLPGETTVWEIRKGGARTLLEIPQPVTGTPINGIEAVGRGNLLVTNGGLDLAAGARLLRVTRGGTKVVADIEAFETQHDPDALVGPQWKTPACEVPGGFSAGPQSNPYHLTRDGATALVADAAGNSVLAASMSGSVELVAVMTPPVVNGDWLVLSPLSAAFPDDPDAVGVDCYVQPVPTSVAVGRHGDYYVGELTGVTPGDFGAPNSPSTGLSRIWRIDEGARNVVCPSAACEEVFSGFTSIMDVAIGPDGMLYVVEADENGWFAASVLGSAAGGTINRCDVASQSCQPIASNLSFPSAIAFDKWGGLWVVEHDDFDENGVPTGVATVSQIATVGA